MAINSVKLYPEDTTIPVYLPLQYRGVTQLRHT
jgi:hypothetical protein